MSSLLYRVRFSYEHRWSPGQMSAYLDGELGPRGEMRLKRHVGECKECRLLLEELRAMLDALHRLPAPTGVGEPNRLAAAVRLRLPEPPPAD